MTSEHDCQMTQGHQRSPIHSQPRTHRQLRRRHSARHAHCPAAGLDGGAPHLQSCPCRMDDMCGQAVALITSCPQRKHLLSTKCTGHVFSTIYFYSAWNARGLDAYRWHDEVAVIVWAHKISCLNAMAFSCMRSSPSSVSFGGSIAMALCARPRPPTPRPSQAPRSVYCTLL